MITPRQFKRPDLETLYGYGIMAVLFLIVLHAPLIVGLSHVLPAYDIFIKAWKEIVLTVLGVIALVIILRGRLLRRLMADRIIQLCLAYIGLHLVLAVCLFTGWLPTIAGLMIDLRFAAFFLLAYLAVMLNPVWLRRGLKTVTAGAVVVLGFGLLQITVLPDNILGYLGYGSDTIRPFITIDQNPEFVRINSTLRGPNPLGALAVVYLTLAVAYLRQYWHTKGSGKKRTSLAVIAATGAVLFASYSRSAYIAAVVAIAAVLVVFWRPTRRVITVVGVSSILLIAAMIGLQSTDWYSNVILHEDPESTVVSKSNDGHIESLQDGLDRMLKQPLGAGIGSTGSASLYDSKLSNDTMIENYYLFVAHESGWMGLAMFISIFILVMRALWLRRNTWPALGMFASGLGLAFIALLLPVWADETVALIWWGLAGLIIGRGIINDDETGTRQQKTAGNLQLHRRVHKN